MRISKTEYLARGGGKNEAQYKTRSKSGRWVYHTTDTPYERALRAQLRAAEALQSSGIGFYKEVASFLEAELRASKQGNAMKHPNQESPGP